MPIHNVETPDGQIIKVEAPEGASQEDILSFAQQNYTPKGKPKERTWGEVGTDLGASLLGGVGSLLQVPGQIGALTGLNATEEKPTGLQGVGKSVEEYGESLKSKTLKEKEAARAKKIAEQEGFLNEFGTAIKETILDPALLTSFVFEQIPNFIGSGGGGLLARGAAKALMSDALKVSLGAEKVGSVLGKAGVAGSVGTGAVMQGADIGTDTYEELYKRLEKERPDMPVEERNRIALAQGRKAAIEAFGISLAASMLPGGTAVERAMAGKGLQKTGGFARGLVGEAVSEGLEEGGGKQRSNVAQNEIFPDIDVWKGVGGAAGMGALGGGLFGGMAGLRSNQPVEEELTQPLEQTSIQPPIQPPVQPPQTAFAPTVIPQAYSTQEGIDRATGVNGGGGYTQADLLTPSAKGVREQAQRMATQDLNAVGTPRAPTDRAAAQQVAFDRAAQELGYTDQRQPMPVSPSQSVPYTAPIAISNEARRKLVDAQSEQLAQAQNEPFAFDRRRLEASASAVGGTGQVRGTPRAVLADPNPMVPRAARQRLAVMKEEAAAKGEDPNALVIVPHPTMGGRFAIEKRSMEQPYVAPPIETPTVSQADANKSLESIESENIKNEYLAQKDLKTLAGKRGEDLVANVPSNELAPFVQAHQTLRRIVEENILNRNGVATPEEARMIRDQGLNIPYDSVAAITEEQDSALNVKGKKLLALEDNLDEQRREHHKNLHGPETWMEGFSVPEAPPKQASAEFTGKFLAPEGRTAPAAPTNRTAARTPPEQFGNRSDLPQASQYAGKLEVSENGRYQQLPFQQRTDTPKIEIAKYSLQDVVPTPEAKAMADDVRKKLLPILKRFGLEKMGLRLVDSISNGAEGMYFKNVITLALDSNNPMGVMRHEVIHALKELGAFTNGEWKVLTDMAKKKWINQFYSPELQAAYKEQFDQDGDTTQTFDEYMAEEAIAQAFRFYTETKPPSGLIANLMRRLNNVFQAIREFFMGNGVTDAEQLFLAKNIFSNIESGRMTAGREGVQPRTAPAYAMKTKTGNSATIKQAAEESKLTDQEFAATSLPLQTGDTGVDAFLNQDIGFKKDVLDYLVKRRLESGVPVLDENKEQDKKLIAKLITAEAMAAIRSGGKALDWYDSVIDKTMSIAALKHPELLENPNKQMAFKIAMAISSQGMNVEANIKFADYVYEQYQKTGRFPEIGQGKDQGAMVSNYKLANNMLDILGESELRKFLETEYTIGELQAAGLDVGGELADEKVLGSSIFGPKIGFGFYSNLSGNFEPVTMDMWFMRLIGRITGKLKAFEPEKFKNQVSRLRDSFKQTGNNGVYASDFDAQDISNAIQSDEGAIALARKVSSMHEKDFKNNREAFNAKNRIKTELVAAAETIIDSVDASIDAPSNGSQRRNLRDIVAMVRENVAKLYGKDIPPASLQALIWYPEQELYKSLGVALRVTSQDYAGAIAKHLKEEGYDAERISGAAKQGSRAAQRMAGISKRLETQESGRKSGKVSTEEKRQGFLNTIRRQTFIGGETPFNKTETKNKFFNQKDIKSETQVITGEVIPSAVGEMQQVTELNYQQKNKLNNQILNSKFIQDMAKSLGIKSILKITTGTGGYANSISPNLIVQMANSNIDQAEKDARDLSYAMSYVFQQDATPYFRADPNLIKKGQLGYSIQFSDKLKEGQEKKLFKILQNLLGNDVGYSKLNGNELILINYRGEDGKPFLTNDKTFKQKLEAFIVEAEKIASISSKEVFGANSEYNYNDWNEKGTGSAIATGIQVRRGDQPNIQEKLNNFRESFVTIARQAVEESGAKPRFSLRPEQLALRPSDSGGAGISFNDRKEDAVSYAGSHYGKTKTNILSGGYYGTGLKGAEAKRLAQAQDPRIGRRIYFYIPRANGTMPMRESGVGNHVYTQKFDNILGPGKTMSELYKKAQGDSNAFESFVIDNGYDGYAVPDYGMMVVLNHDIEAKYEGTVGEVHYNKAEPEKGARFSRALGALEPATSLVPDTSLNNTGNLGVLPDARDIEPLPIRFAVGMVDPVYAHKGYGANKMIDRINKDSSRKPPVVTKELLEDLVQQVERVAQSYTRIYKEQGKLIAYNPITTESLILSRMGDHYSVVSVYKQNNMGKYGNVAWTGKTPTEFKRYLTPEEPQKGIPVKAGASGVIRKPVATTFKQRKVMSPEAIQEMADDVARVKGKASLRTPPALLKQTLTDSFKRWFGKSAIVDMNGDPKVMYHGTARDITEFRAKQAGAIFVTDKPSFAEDFTGLSENFMRKELFNGMSKNEKVVILKKALNLAKKDKKLSKEESNYVQNYIKVGADSTFGMIPSAIEEEIIQLLTDALPSRANIMPVFVRAENPFDFQNPDHIERIVAESKKISGNDQYRGGSYVAQITNAIKSGAWEEIESKPVQEAIRAAGFDGFYIKENGIKNLAVYDPNQIKSAIGNTGAFSRESNDIRYSLTNNVPPAVHTKLLPNQTAGQQVTAAATNAMKTIQKDGYFTGLRNGFVDDTSSLGHTLASKGMSQFANNKLRADMLRHAQSNSINLINIGLQSGVPVLNSDGSIIIEKTESNMARSIILADKLDSNPYVKASKLKGGRGFVAEVARALRGADIKQEDAAMIAEGQQKLNDADSLEASLNSAVQAGGQNVKTIASAKNLIDKLRAEGKKLVATKRELQVDDAQIQWAEAQLKNVPELKEIFGIWKDINNALTDLSEDTGVISKEQAQKYRDKKFYVPLFKAREDLAEAFFHGSSAKNVAKSYKLEGADIDRNVWENLQKQYAMTIAVAYENQTRKVATEQLHGYGLAKTVDNPNDPNINLRYKENGEIVNVIAENPNDIAAFQMMNYELGPIMKAISATTRALRFGALVNPMFWIKQLIRDPIHASLTNNQIITPFHSAVAFAKVLSKSSESAKVLEKYGVIGAVDSTVDLKDYIGQLGKEKKTPQMLSSALHKVMQMHEASDAATRVAIFDSAKKEALKKGMSEEEAVNFAVFRARESINFGVRGNSKVLNTLRHSIPFFQAAITSLDTVYRAAFGYGLPPAEKRKAQLIFAKRAAVMALMSTMYAMMYTDDDEYKDLPDYVKDGNWLFPITTSDGRKSFVRIPVPFEIGYLFKTIPEAAWRLYSGTSTGKEVAKSYLDGLIHNLPGGGILIPQAFKPALESITNHSFFTGNPIEGMSDQGKPVVERGRNASEFSKAASEAGLHKVGLSPAKIDALIKGYFAELGGTFLMASSNLIDSANGVERPAKNIESIVGVKAFMTDPNVSKAVADFYTLEHNAKEMTNMFASLKKEGLFERAREYLNDDEKKNQMLAAPVFRKIGEQLGKIKTEIKRIENREGMTAEEKRTRINELQQMLGQTAKKGYEVAERAGISR